jgi:hypothetical protein
MFMTVAVAVVDVAGGVRVRLRVAAALTSLTAGPPVGTTYTLPARSSATDDELLTSEATAVFLAEDRAPRTKGIREVPVVDET